MKRVISLVVLVIALSGIISFTIYTLNHKGIKEEVETKVIKKIEKITSKMSNKSLTEIYNVYLNEKRHKLKLEYSLAKELDKEQLNLSLILYFDGEVIFDQIILISNNSNLEELFNDKEISDKIKITDNNLNIITDKNNEYFIINVGSYIDKYVEKYYIYDNKGNILTDNDGILIYDSSLFYTSDNGDDLDIFYDEDRQVLAKLEENVLYVFESKDNDDKFYLEEYKYVIKEGKIYKELLNSYENIKLEK